MPAFELLVVGVSWPPETFIRRKLEGLARQGVRVTAAAAPNRGDEVRLPGVRLMPLALLSGSPWRRGADFLRNLAKAAMRSPAAVIRAAVLALRQEGGFGAKLQWLSKLLPFAGQRPDIVHFEWNFAATAYLPLFDLLRRPSVVSCRGAHINVAPHNPARRGDVRSLPATFQRATAIHCVSEAILKEGKAYGLTPEKAFLIRPAVDTEFFRPLESRPAANGYFRVAATGSLGWRKAYEFALMAIRRLLDRGYQVRCDIIGDGDKTSWQRVRYTVQDLSLENAVVLLGPQPPGEVRRVLQGADAFLLSSLSEGISNAVLEAMACGLPVVSTECGGMREAVTDGVEGFLTPLYDPGAMAGALEKLLLNHGLRASMGANARARAVLQFGLKDQIAAWVTAYDRILAR
jgi:colanic acid/amylovoran biosynthesis glycosyltransferase